MNRPGVRQVSEGSGEQGKMEQTGCKITCGAPTTLVVKGLMMMMMIHKDQTGFLKGRNIGENIKLLYDTLVYTEKEEIPGLLLLIDFEKAFDSISWSFMQKCLSFLTSGQM